MIKYQKNRLSKICEKLPKTKQKNLNITYIASFTYKFLDGMKPLSNSKLHRIIFLTIYTLLFSHASAQILSSHLVLELNFDGNAVADGSSRNHVVSETNTTFTEGFNEDGIYLSGDNSFIEVNFSAHLEIPNNLTISLWYKHQEQESSTAFYSLVEQSANENGGHSRYGIWVQNNLVHTCIEPDNCSIDCQRCVSIFNNLVEGEWYHIACTYDGNLLRIFVNGENISTQSYQVKTGISVRPYPLTIGTDPYDGEQTFLIGSLDEIKIYDTALTVDQIVSLYQEFNTTNTPKFYESAFAVSPNPAFNFIRFDERLSPQNISIFSLRGEKMKSFSRPSQNLIDVQGLPCGMYFLIYDDSEISYFTKILIVR